MSQVILITTLSGRIQVGGWGGETVCKWRTAKITLGENNPVYSNQAIVHVPVCNGNRETLSWLGRPSVWDKLRTVSSSMAELLHFPTVSMDSSHKIFVTMNTMFDVLPMDQNCLFLPNNVKIKVNLLKVGITKQCNKFCRKIRCWWHTLIL